jgi:hypothetical protein
VYYGTDFSFPVLVKLIQVIFYLATYLLELNNVKMCVIYSYVEGCIIGVDNIFVLNFDTSCFCNKQSVLDLPLGRARILTVELDNLFVFSLQHSQICIGIHRILVFSTLSINIHLKIIALYSISSLLLDVTHSTLVVSYRNIVPKRR